MNYKSYIIENDIDSIKSKIVLFYGENLGLKDSFKKKIKLNNHKAIVKHYTQEEILKNLEKFFEEFFNISLFDEHKIFFVDQVNDKILDLIQDLENKKDDQKIFLFAELLDKRSKIRNYFEKSKILGIVPCYSDNELSLKKIILDKLKNFGGLSAENINIIIDNSNLDRIKLNNELDKIETYFVNKKIISSELLKLLNLNENDDFNLLKDAALSGNNRITNKLLTSTIIENEKTLFYINNINQRLNKLKELVSNDIGTIQHAIDTIKPPIFWKDKPSIIEQTKKWNFKKITNAQKKTFDIEIKLKSSSNLNKDILIKKILIDICSMANA